MLKILKRKWLLVALIATSTLSIGLVVALLNTAAFEKQKTNQAEGLQVVDSVETSSALNLALLQPAERAVDLSVMANGTAGIDRDRARYMLATDLINQQQADQALPLLRNLEKSYQVLAPYVLLRQAQAQAATRDQESAIATWTRLIKKYPESTATAEALYLLGQPSIDQVSANQASANQTSTSQASANQTNDSQPATSPSSTYWNTLITQYPAHPLSTAVAFYQLTAQQATPATKANSAASPLADTFSLLKLIAYHGHQHPEYTAALTRLTSEYNDELTAEDWAAIGFGYWETQNYAEAGDAYAKAPRTPLNLYRAARGKERGDKDKEAIVLYQMLDKAFPAEPETADGLLNLAGLQKGQSALATLDEVVGRFSNSFPDKAAEAIADRATLLESLGSAEVAKQAQDSILSEYSGSKAAAQIRLKRAKENAKANNLTGAISWAQQLVDAAPSGERAAEAGFWLGKWHSQQDQVDQARKAFENVIVNHPESYYAWRSAVHLGWNVGDFDTVRTLRPKIVLPRRRQQLPAGSDALQELYLLGHDQTAWSQWQSEFDSRQMPTVAEQFTDGVLRLGIGDNLDGIFMVSSLGWRDRPAEITDYQRLKQTSTYSQAIYPFPFSELISGRAEDNNLNPLLVTALVRQESRFEPDITSVVGAVGLMQVMPATGEWISQQINQADYRLFDPKDNVKFGTWYLDYTHRQFADNSLFAVASYNAGPGAVSSWVAEKDFANADEFVEIIPYPETQGYVESVFGGYWNYLRIYNPEIAAKVAAL
ncbi:Transglycosylase SLT domain protein [Synechococcus sp. PCC 7335]|uniref:transglycosylase SLT domain-containing protein n=1 Tax=Synechococcus sp. (strain ATCC 29403 / PCC 7335) TaxID=91464 RepID=UPI00017ED1E7|nr:transglycosylase SLT domain-containing protein [Synechococcus sp. PCC 7335]EDX85512.1 Transglycosylase SLT domain protein [Synechococcus sp. PCC 7335]